MLNVGVVFALLAVVKGDWRSEANARIEQHRKADINVRVSGTGNVHVELQQTDMDFILGSAVDAHMIVATDATHRRYQEVFYKNFNWAVLENSLKWHIMERNKGHINYNTPLTAIDTLRSHGIKMRCHCMFWDVDRNNADWVHQLYGQQMVQAVHERINGMTSHTRGKCEHWDVNNENLHGQFFEQHSHDNNITMEMFRWIHQADSHPKLFLNDYNIIAQQSTATRFRDLGKRYKAAGVPISGMGIQGHLKDYMDVNTIKQRVEIVAQAGIPIIITELGVNHADVHQRAIKIVDDLTMFYSLPEVEGVMLWGFWDGRIWEHDAALYTGSNVNPNEAGRAFENLIQSWKTHASHNVHGGNTWTVRGHKGDYTVKVSQNGHVIDQQTFHLGNGGHTVDINIGGGSASIVG